MLKLYVVIASTRPMRQGTAVGAWAFEQCRAHGKFDVELVDLAEVDLPMFDEPRHPRFGKYEHDHTKAWGERVARADAFVFVTPEYNHGPPPSLVNALDFVSREWAYKPVAFVSYGGVSAGTRGVGITKQMISALRMVPLFDTVAIPFFAQHVNDETGVFDPGDVQVKAAVAMLDELLKWAGALKPMRGG